MKLAGFLGFVEVLAHHGAHRHLQHQVLARGAVHARTLAVRAAFCLEVVLEAVVDERGQAGVGLDDHVAAMPPVAAVRAALGHVRLAAKRHAARAAVAALHVYAHLVYEQPCLFSPWSRRSSAMLQAFRHTAGLPSCRRLSMTPQAFRNPAGPCHCSAPAARPRGKRRRVAALPNGPRPACRLAGPAPHAARMPPAAGRSRTRPCPPRGAVHGRRPCGRPRAPCRRARTPPCRRPRGTGASYEKCPLPGRGHLQAKRCAIAKGRLTPPGAHARGASRHA